MKKLKIPRSLVLLIVFFIMFSILIVRLFQLQIVKGQEYENNFILQTKREIVLSGARGNIYDCNGKPLATNKLANKSFILIHASCLEVYIKSRKSYIRKVFIILHL